MNSVESISRGFVYSTVLMPRSTHFPVLSNTASNLFSKLCSSSPAQSGPTGVNLIFKIRQMCPPVSHLASTAGYEPNIGRDHIKHKSEFKLCF